MTLTYPRIRQQREKKLYDIGRNSFINLKYKENETHLNFVRFAFILKNIKMKPIATYFIGSIFRYKCS